MSFLFDFDVIILAVDNLKTRFYVNDSLIFLYSKIKQMLKNTLDPEHKSILEQKLILPLLCDLGSEEFLGHCRIMSKSQSGRIYQSQPNAHLKILQIN